MNGSKLKILGLCLGSLLIATTANAYWGNSGGVSFGVSVGSDHGRYYDNDDYYYKHGRRYYRHHYGKDFYRHHHGKHHGKHWGDRHDGDRHDGDRRDGDRHERGKDEHRNH